MDARTLAPPMQQRRGRQLPDRLKCGAAAIGPRGAAMAVPIRRERLPQLRAERRRSGRGRGRIGWLNGGGGRGFDPNMTPEERQKRMEERMAAMTPEQREAFQERMAARQNGRAAVAAGPAHSGGGQGGGGQRRTGFGGSSLAAAKGCPNRQRAAAAARRRSARGESCRR